MDRKGICVAGNMIVDILYRVQGLPRPGELTSILEGISRSSGGALCNVIADLAALDPDLPLSALGRVGADGEGDFILDRLRKYPNINLSGVKREGVTSFTAVMADEISKQRSFFHYRGANAFFCGEDINWDTLDAAFLHIGYILLLDALDREDPEFGTKMARLLWEAQRRGIKTSLDVVSETKSPGEAGGRFKRLVPPALKYADYCIINELEAEQVTGVPLRDAEGVLIRAHMREALEGIRGFGVSSWAVVHCPEGGFGLDREGVYEAVPSFALPDGYIKGTVGAGDAFCAGTLYGAYKGKNLREGIELGIASAACSLSEPGAAEGMRSAEEALALYRKLPRYSAGP
ncbi:MAG: carbohydrate kinase family protein [Spirochaetaceae bacterium]|jgi:sugar/nucleoside kinase (ribokinase family)|nr:carbohydrate kinase family protein [Spirochaetaceae bacterium]